jgi:hypothetical protein
MIVINVFSSFLSPLGINRLLKYISLIWQNSSGSIYFTSYLETRGEGAIVRPWIWIVWLFVGPIIGSLAFQWYIFIAVRNAICSHTIHYLLVTRPEPLCELREYSRSSYLNTRYVFE